MPGHPGLPGVDAGPLGESGLGRLIHALDDGRGDALPAVIGDLRKALTKRMGPNTSTLGNLASLSGPKDRLLHPPPDRDPGHIDQPALANGPETGGRGQGRLQLRMDRDHPVLSPFALPDDQGRAVLIEVQVPGFQGQGFGHPESGPPLFQHDQPGPGVGGGGDEGVDLVPLQVLRQLETILPK